jgi:sarcosine oxidase subunit beta
MQRRLGIHTELLSPGIIREIIPGLEITDFVTAAYEEESGYADPHSTVNAYANAARRLGAKIFLNTPVTGVRFEGRRVVAVETLQESFAAPQVVNCAGPWGARVAGMAGLQLPINACRVQVAFFRRPVGYEAVHPVIADFIHAAYFRPETGQLTLAGLVDPSEANAIVDPDNYKEQVDSEFVLDAGERFIHRYPPMETSQHTGGFAGLYAITPDWHPIIDELPSGSGFFTCAGFSGHGFKLGPAVGLLVADLVTGQSQPKFDPYLFRFSRYMENKPVKGQYEYSIAG